MDISVVAAAREDDRPPVEALHTASLADRLGYPEVWIGEGPTWDAFALTTAVGLATDRVSLTAGPVPVSVRDPATIARGAASAAALVGRPVGVALGTSSVRVVEGVHGRSRARAVTVLAESAEAVRTLLDGGERIGRDGESVTGQDGEPGSGPVPEFVRGSGFRRRLAPAGGPLTVAAFGDRAIAVAARHADRMVLDLVSPGQVAGLRAKLDRAARLAGRRPPRLAAWLPTAVDPADESRAQIMRSVVGYLTVRGYGEMFTAAGFGKAVEMARAGAGQEDLLAALPQAAAGVVGLVGDATAVRARMREYAAAGLDEVAIVPAAAGDPGGQHTLAALAAEPG